MLNSQSITRLMAAPQEKTATSVVRIETCCQKKNPADRHGGCRGLPDGGSHFLAAALTPGASELALSLPAARIVRSSGSR